MTTASQKPGSTGAPASKVELPHMPAKPETESAAETSSVPLSENTKAEMEEGRRTLAAAGDQTKAEMELGAKNIGKSAPPPAKNSTSESTSSKNKE